MNHRHVITPLRGFSISIVGCLASILSGCKSDAPRGDASLTAAPTPVRTVLVLPSRLMIDLAEATGSELGIAPGRRNGRLGGEPLPLAGPGVSVIEVRDDQRIVNGRVRSQSRWTTRSGQLRGGYR
jgi:hypothetical protein